MGIKNCHQSKTLNTKNFKMGKEITEKKSVRIKEMFVPSGSI